MGCGEWLYVSFIKGVALFGSMNGLFFLVENCVWLVFIKGCVRRSDKNVLMKNKVSAIKSPTHILKKSLGRKI